MAYASWRIRVEDDRVKNSTFDTDLELSEKEYKGFYQYLYRIARYLGAKNFKRLDYGLKRRNL